jgi:biopolymer transport protein TolR
MAMSAGSAGGSGRRGRRRGGRTGRGALTEINVTPLVDVMLVLLIIFMISAPLLAGGVPVELPKTEAAALKDAREPVTVTVKRDGAIYVQDDQTAYETMIDRLKAAGGGASDEPIYVRADGGAPYAAVARVMAKLSVSGFTKIDLITEPDSSSPNQP